MLQLNRNLVATVIVSSCNRRRHLERCLYSFSRQHGLERGSFEVVVADRGSSDGSQEMVRHLSMRMPYRLRVVTQASEDFGSAATENEALRLAEGSYLLLVDGDCVYPPTYLARQFRDQTRRTAWASDCVRLGQHETECISTDAVSSGDFLTLVPRRLPTILASRFRTDRICQWLRHPSRPRFSGHNLAVWADDLVSINGFDESLSGWSRQLEDLARRLRLVGIRIKTNANRTFGYHLWHPVRDRALSEGQDQKAGQYLGRPLTLPKCLNGLVKRSVHDLCIRVSASRACVSEIDWPTVVALQENFAGAASDEVNGIGGVEIEIRVNQSPVSNAWKSAKRVQLTLDGRKRSRAGYRPHLVLDTQQVSERSQRPTLKIFDPEQQDTTETLKVGNRVAGESQATHEGSDQVRHGGLDVSRWFLGELDRALSCRPDGSAATLMFSDLPSKDQRIAA